MLRLLKPTPSPSRQRAWISLTASAALHLSLLLAAAGLTRQGTPTERHPDRIADQSRRIEMIYVSPPDPVPPPLALPSPPPPPPAPVRRTAPEPEPNAPPEALRSSGVDTEESSTREQAAAEITAPRDAPAAENAEATMESEARRIFGRPRLATRTGAGPQAIRPMEAWLPENSERCIPRQGTPADPARAARLGTVVGRIFRQDSGRPLAGAHLHMIGTPYVAFTDGQGEYRFRFDMALVDNCRTQYVKVTAAGYESRLLVLVVGPRVRSEDVRLRRR